MNNNLPTTPGSYWWREKDGDEWKYGEVYRGHSGDLYWETMAIGGQPLDHMQGQWAKAHKPDEGIEAWAVFNQTTSEMVVSWEDEKESQTMCNNLNEISTKHKYTCEPVTIFRKDQKA